MKKYFLIVGIAFLGACARPHDVNPIQELGGTEDAPADETLEKWFPKQATTSGPR